MQRAAVVGVVSMFLAAGAGCGGTRTLVQTVTVTQRSGPVRAQGDQRLWGRVESLRHAGDHFLLRFDPAWFLSGLTANVAQAEDQGTHCRPSACPPVANDNYVIDESHRLLTFVVPASVRGSVLTKNASNGGPFPTTTISIARLARLVAGNDSLQLFEPLSSGIWILVHGDTVRTFAQQYAP